LFEYLNEDAGTSQQYCYRSNVHFLVVSTLLHSRSFSLLVIRSTAVAGKWRNSVDKKDWSGLIDEETSVQSRPQSIVINGGLLAMLLRPVSGQLCRKVQSISSQRIVQISAASSPQFRYEIRQVLRCNSRRHSRGYQAL